MREHGTAYDATYIALAEALACELVTPDAASPAPPARDLPDEGRPHLRRTQRWHESERGRRTTNRSRGPRPSG